MITIHRLAKYRKGNLDHLVSLYINGRGQIVDYEKDFPPIELLHIPHSFLKNSCPMFIENIVRGCKNEIILTDENIEILRSELKQENESEAIQIISKEILRFVSKYEAIKERCHLAYRDNHA